MQEETGAVHFVRTERGVEMEMTNGCTRLENEMESLDESFSLKRAIIESGANLDILKRMEPDQLQSFVRDALSLSIECQMRQLIQSTLSLGLDDEEDDFQSQKETSRSKFRQTVHDQIGPCPERDWREDFDSAVKEGMGHLGLQLEDYPWRTTPEALLHWCQVAGNHQLKMATGFTEVVTSISESCQ
jgi:hypothetical protein